MESDHDHRGLAPQQTGRIRENRCLRRRVRKVERGTAIKSQKRLLLSYTLFATRNLTPELSRPDLRPRQSDNLRRSAEAAKRARLERIVSYQGDRSRSITLLVRRSMPRSALA